MGPKVVPYVVGQWVRGSRFYGREAQIAEVLDGHRDSLWLLGLRRIGKTSLLRQVELEAATASRRYFPVYWDLQGAEDPLELTESFRDALLEVEERLREEEIAIDDVASDDLVGSIKQLRRRLRDRDLVPLFLCDEAEALIVIQRRDAPLVRKLSRLLGSAEGVRTVIASTIRLLDLARENDTSSFLDGFTPPLFVRGLDEDAARSLVRQAKEDAGSRPRIDDEIVERVRMLCGNHPYLLQLLSKRVLEIGSFDAAREQVESDPMLSHFFAVDFGTLDDDERAVLRVVSAHDSIAVDGIADESEIDAARLSALCRRLEGLGLIGADGDRRYAIAVPLFRSWLNRLPETRGENASDDETGARVGEWSIHRDLNEIRRGDETVRLEPRAMNLLVYLAGRAGRVIGKDEIFDALWEGVFVSESALTRTVADLRKALGDDAKNPQYIATISKRGYRMVAPVIGLSGAVSPAAPERAGSRSVGVRFYVARGTESLSLGPGEHWVGRDPDCFISIPSPKVSRRHARFLVDAEGATIDDAGSRNGTIVNRRRIETAERLQDGDTIVIGPETLVFRVFDPADATETDLGLPGGGRGDRHR